MWQAFLHFSFSCLFFFSIQFFYLHLDWNQDRNTWHILDHNGSKTFCRIFTEAALYVTLTENGKRKEDRWGNSTSIYV